MAIVGGPNTSDAGHADRDHTSDGVSRLGPIFKERSEGGVRNQNPEGFSMVSAPVSERVSDNHAGRLVAGNEHVRQWCGVVVFFFLRFQVTKHDLLDKTSPRHSPRPRRGSTPTRRRRRVRGLRLWTSVSLLATTCMDETRIIMSSSCKPLFILRACSSL